MGVHVRDRELWLAELDQVASRGRKDAVFDLRKKIEDGRPCEPLALLFCVFVVV